MAFGQAAGPPAAAKQVEQLAGLLEERGFASFKEARHPFGLNQRQAAGKFTTGEVAELITRLESEADERATSPDAVAGPVAGVAADDGAARRRRAREEEVAAKIHAEVLATELVNRGWCVIPPPE